MVRIPAGLVLVQPGRMRDILDDAEINDLSDCGLYLPTCMQVRHYAKNGEENWPH